MTFFIVCLFFFSLTVVFGFHPHCSMSHYFIPFWGGLTHSPLYGYIFIDGHWVFSFFGAITNNPAMNTYSFVFVQIYSFRSLSIYLSVELLIHMITSDFIRNHQNALQSSCTILHSHQKCDSCDFPTSSTVLLLPSILIVGILVFL